MMFLLCFGLVLDHRGFYSLNLLKTLNWMIILLLLRVILFFFLRLLLLMLFLNELCLVGLGLALLLFFCWMLGGCSVLLVRGGFSLFNFLTLFLHIK